MWESVDDRESGGVSFIYNRLSASLNRQVLSGMNGIHGGGEATEATVPFAPGRIYICRKCAVYVGLQISNFGRADGHRENNSRMTHSIYSTDPGRSLDRHATTIQTSNFS